MGTGTIAARCRYLVPLLVLFGILPGVASSEIMQRIQAGIEGVARGMDYVGNRAGQIIGPGIPLAEETVAAFEYKRTVEEQYPTGQSPMIALSNEFGPIRVNVWDERIIKITAEIVAGAETEALAEHLAQIIEIRVSHGENYLECRTVYPEVKSSSQMLLSVNYEVYVPRDAGLAVDNFFGDVCLVGIGGMVVAEVQYGSLELKDIQGKVRARVQGDFPVHVTGLQQGGSFKFQGASAEISTIQGEVDVSHFRGKVVFRQIAEDTHLTINSDSGQTLLVLPPDANPDLSAVVSYGKLESDLDMVRSLRGTQIVASHANADARQQIAINAAFSEVVIAVEGGEEQATPTPGESKVFTDTRQESVSMAEAEAISVAAISGNIQVEGADIDHVLVEATRVVWTPSAAAALDALDALELQVVKEQGVIKIQTRVAQDMTMFDCESYRIDLRILCPRELPVQIHAEEGVTVVDGIGAGVTLKQRKGEIGIDHVKGTIQADNEAGDIKIRDCSGPVDAATRYGSVSIEKVYGNVRTSATEGHTYLDMPQGDVFVRHKSGDVRILCLDPIQGNFDVVVEDGNLNVFVAPDSDATVNVKTVNGRVQSSLSLSGTINRDFQEFFGRLNNGTHTVRLETLNGDVFLN